MRLKNKILEQVTDSSLKDELYQKLKMDIPIFFTIREEVMPDYDNVIETELVKIVVLPQDEQLKLLNLRVKELYDELSPNLNEFTEFLLSQDKGEALKILNENLTQYDAEETYAYLKNAKQLGSLVDYSELVDIEKTFDETTKTELQTYMFFYKGDFKSYGSSIIPPKIENSCTYLYNESENYDEAVKYFSNRSPDEYKHLFKDIAKEKHKEQQME